MQNYNREFSIPYVKMSFSVLYFELQADKHVRGFCLAPLELHENTSSYLSEYYINLQGLYIIIVFWVIGKILVFL